jgi:hypothetical protein
MPARHRLAADAPDAVAQSIALARALAQRLAPATAAPRDASAAPA